MSALRRVLYPGDTLCESLEKRRCFVVNPGFCSAFPAKAAPRATRSKKGAGEKFKVRTEIRQGIRAALIEPKQANAAVFALKAPRARLHIGIAISQVNESEGINLKTLHHLMHTGCPSLHSFAHCPPHNFLFLKIEANDCHFRKTLS